MAVNAYGAPPKHNLLAERDAAGSHAASAVTVNPSGLAVVTTTDVQAALAELDAATVALQAGLQMAAGSYVGDSAVPRTISTSLTTVEIVFLADTSQARMGFAMATSINNTLHGVNATLNMATDSTNAPYRVNIDGGTFIVYDAVTWNYSTRTYAYVALGT